MPKFDGKQCAAFLKYVSQVALRHLIRMGFYRKMDGNIRTMHEAH